MTCKYMYRNEHYLKHCCVEMSDVDLLFGTVNDATLCLVGYVFFKFRCLVSTKKFALLNARDFQDAK